MEDTLPHVRAVGVGATTGVVGAQNEHRTVLEYAQLIRVD